jgi:1,6-anhydro-N-acetylmuramate kinase
MKVPSTAVSADTRHVVGTMTGTSIDGDLDAALVSITGRGLDMRARLVRGRSTPLGALADDLRRAASGTPLAAAEFARIAREFGDAHANAIDALCTEVGIRPDLSVLHGQTIFHAPPLSWQLIDPWPVVTRVGCRVRYDLRNANLASGGQGAPITPLADFVLFADDIRPKSILNLGGFANATMLPPRRDGVGAIAGLDLCPCNHLLDRVARTRLARPFDDHGRAARSGTPNASLVDRIASALLASTRGAPRAPQRSLGTGDEALESVDATANLSPADACATVVEALASALAQRLREVGHGAGVPIIVAGGSARHAVLRERLAIRTESPVETSETHASIPVESREAAGMAVLGALADDGVRYTLPQVVGALSHALDSALVTP